jgi:predicted transcriptional regulator
MVKLPAEAKLRRRREELGLSRREVAERAKLPVSRIWAAEDPNGEIKDEDREKIVDVLNEHKNHIAALPDVK